MEPALLVAIAAVITALGSAFISPFLAERKAKREAAKDAATGQQATDAAGRDFLLTLVNFSREEVTRWKDAYDAASTENTTLKQTLRTNLERAQETEERMLLAVDYLVALANRRKSVTSSEVSRWATIALDRSIPRDEFERLMQDTEFDDTVIPN
ncbi:hypothetical protein O1W71_16280 [Microbacterium sp. H37-C3]|uniref:hypothetical protein n=1 Tax=Microbacterium sp. H37-C3 TaxID=3004354 RepID=UPI0022AFEF6A|nr:hypothetical protein [Microbacterium sp. H37-C3]MCZ4069230.1 hypothetical protein [Microbacterium sp. H37-C3]